MRQFLGVVQFTCDHHPFIAILLRPFYDLLKGQRNGRITETPELKTAFQRIKNEMASQPFLHLYYCNEITVLQTDASKSYWAGGLWNQMPDGTMRICGYHSGKFTEAQEKLCISVKETLAVKFCLMKWRHKILGTTIFCDTDNQDVFLLRNCHLVCFGLHKRLTNTG